MAKTKTCPHCAEEIKSDAIYCKHCKTDIEKEDKQESIQETKTCPFCSEDVRVEANKCKHCQSDLTEDKKTETGTEIKSQKATGAVTGFIAGLGCGIWVIIFGIILSLTGVGAIIGIPMILVGLFMPVIGPFIGLAQIKGKCPHCGKLLSASSMSGAVTCKYCQKRVIIDNKKFIKVE